MSALVSRLEEIQKNHSSWLVGACQSRQSWILSKINLNCKFHTIGTMKVHLLQEPPLLPPSLLLPLFSFIENTSPIFVSIQKHPPLQATSVSFPTFSLHIPSKLPFISFPCLTPWASCSWTFFRYCRHQPLHHLLQLIHAWILMGESCFQSCILVTLGIDSSSLPPSPKPLLGNPSLYSPSNVLLPTHNYWIQELGYQLIGWD